MVIVRIWEGLGNQMFQYAFARALKEKGLDVRLDLNKSYDEVFGTYRRHNTRINSVQNYRITLPQIDVSKYGKYFYLRRGNCIERFFFILASYGLGKYKFYEEVSAEYSDMWNQISGESYIKGWFQNEKYFQDIRDILVKEFVPRKKIKVTKQLSRAMKDKESVSIHIRRGDYVKIGKTIGLEYYTKAVALMKNKYSNPIFLVFSDDIEWTKRNLDIDGRCIYVDGDFKDYEELFIMSRCKSNIIANSTFSWWAAWLNPNSNKYVIAPKKWSQGQESIIPSGWYQI